VYSQNAIDELMKFDEYGTNFERKTE
jgi:hypothetical protein